jgi:putative membrane protein
MRILLAAAATLTLLAGSSFAQTSPETTTPSVSSPTATNPKAPVPGANSFTEGQAKSRIESNGFSNVSALRKDAEGVWRGTAMKNGASVSVGLDFQGNVVSN